MAKGPLSVQFSEKGCMKCITRSNRVGDFGDRVSRHLNYFRYRSRAKQHSAAIALGEYQQSAVHLMMELLRRRPYFLFERKSFYVFVTGLYDIGKW